MNKTKKFFVVSFFVVLMVFTIFSSFKPKAQAASTDNVYGYAWSSNIGWISLNCTNTNTCGTSNYGLTIANNGDLTGYAWSSNIGWIKFGGFANSDFPNISGDGTQPHNANVSGSNVTGWARACGGLNDQITNPQTDQTLPNDTCTGVTRADGWDGWISLIGNNYDVTVSSSGAMTGFAWGSDVIGWIQFNGNTSPQPSLSLNASANGTSGTTLTVNSGDQITLSSLGSLLNTSSVNGVASYTVDPNGAANWPASESCPTSSTNPLSYAPFVVTNPSSTAAATYTYTLTCKKASDNSNFASNTITIIVNPTPANTFSLLANGATEITIHSGDNVTINTFATPGYLKPTNAGATTNDPDAHTHWYGNEACPQSLTPVTLDSFSLINPSTTVTTTYYYDLRCIVVNTGNVIDNHVNVNILPAPPVVSLSLQVSVNGSTPSVGPITVNPGDQITLSSTGSLLNTAANAGTKSLSWSGAVTCPSSTTTALSYAPITLNAAGTNNYYKISCPKASDGTAYASNTVTVYVSSPPPPTVILKAFSDPAFAHQIVTPLPSSGGNVYMQWSSTNATSCVSSNLNNPIPLNISGWSGLTQATTGSTGAINITHSTTFVMVCSANGSSDGSMAPVQVGHGSTDVPPGCPGMGTPPCPKKQPVFIEI